MEYNWCQETTVAEIPLYLVTLCKCPKESGKALWLSLCGQRPHENRQLGLVPLIVILHASLASHLHSLCVSSTARNWSNLSVLGNKPERRSSAWHPDHEGHYCVHESPRPLYACTSLGMVLSLGVYVSFQVWRTCHSYISVCNRRWCRWSNWNKFLTELQPHRLFFRPPTYPPASPSDVGIIGFFCHSGLSSPDRPLGPPSAHPCPSPLAQSHHPLCCVYSIYSIW